MDGALLAPACALIERETVPAQSPSAVLAVARRSGPPLIRAFGLARWDPEQVPAEWEREHTWEALVRLAWELPGFDREGAAYWSPAAFGHSGSSGTVLRIDPGHDLVAVFLGSNSSGVKSKGAVMGAAVSALVSPPLSMTV